MKKTNPTSGRRGFGTNKNEVNEEARQKTKSLQGTEQTGSDTLVEEALAKFGVVKKRRFSEQAYEELGPYDRLVSRFGATTLRSFESALLMTSSVLVISLVFSGIVLSIDAFLHASFERGTSEDFITATTALVDEATIKIVQPLFTPLILLFFVASISLGILKTLQLTSSKTVYRE
ncbi:hypothetical protein GpartN1_g1110.t1 [Galdieria partita]|uniref:Uncharacterized protein n=1 Tax=Galdieria partita TaxID=83374 RepID=A0A9C7PSA1_9RHOD|nr:hypothetical protein GpartN1_g1110.t1 [Galdieria partita]